MKNNGPFCYDCKEYSIKCEKSCSNKKAKNKTWNDVCLEMKSDPKYNDFTYTHIKYYN